MSIAVTLALAIVPSWLLVRYFHERDLYPEPPHIIWRTFFLGALTTIPVLIVTFPALKLLPVVDGFVLSGFQFAFLYAAIPEELFKLLVLLGYSLRRREFDEPMDGIVYGAVVAQGFAALENALYSVAVGPVMTVVRGFTAVPAHACLGVIMGYYVGRARFEPQRRGVLIATGFIAAVMVHGLYDTPLMIINNINTQFGEIPEEYESFTLACTAIGLVVLLAAIIVAASLWRRALREQLEHPTPPALPCTPAPSAIPGPPPLPHPASIASPPIVRTIALTGSPRQSAGVSALKLFSGIALSVAGGACLFASIYAVFDPGTDHRYYVNLAFFAVVLGYSPLMIGLRLFRAGVRGFNVSRPAGGPTVL